MSVCAGSISGKISRKISSSDSRTDSFGSGMGFCRCRLSHSRIGLGTGSWGWATGSPVVRLCSAQGVGATEVGVPGHHARTTRDLCLSLGCAGALSRHWRFVLQGR